MGIVTARSEFGTPPNDVALEQAVIGCCLVHPDQIPTVASECVPDDFCHAPHPQVIGAMFELSKDNRLVSPLSVSSALVGLSALSDVGGHAYLADLSLAAPNESPAHLARLVADLRHRRDALSALSEAQEAITNRSTPILEALQPAQEAADIAADRASREADSSTLDSCNALLTELQSAIDGKPVPQISTGLECLNKILGGLQAGDFCIYAGRPGMLKTGLLATTGYAAALSGAPVLFFELEMTRKQLLARIGCSIDYAAHPDDSMSYEWFRLGDIQPYQLERLAHALRHIPDNLRIFDRSGMTIHEIAALARGYAKRAKQMGLVVIDYLQLIQAGDRYKGNSVQEITEISKATKNLAKTIGWPVLVACQLSRAVESREDKRPQLQDLRESGQLEQDADQVIGLYREGYYVRHREPDRMDPRWGEWNAEYEAVKNRMELLVRKNRHGRAEKVEVFCDLRSSAILDKEQ
jgi:replicative DNA helicase